MRKQKKKREPKKSFTGDAPVPELDVEIKGGALGTEMVFKLSNRGLKMLKSGLVLSRTYLMNEQQCEIKIQHRDAGGKDVKV